jgi:hypothetical protein
MKRATAMADAECRYTISELIQIAEEQTSEAQRACEAKEPDAEERLNSWSETLAVLRTMKERGLPHSLNG